MSTALGELFEKGATENAVLVLIEPEPEMAPERRRNRQPRRHKSQLTSEQRKNRSRKAAAASWANTSDRTSRTEPGRTKFMARFNTDEERKEWFAELARRSATRRRRQR